MVASFSTEWLNPGLIPPRSKPLLPPSLHVLSLPRSKSSIRLRLSSNRIRHWHLSCSSPPSSGTTRLEDQPQAQAEENKTDSSTEVVSQVKQVQGGSEEGDQQRSELGKVVGTAGIVLAVVAGSTAALLSMNAILAELSDKLFDGRIRIQDFF